MQIFTDFFNRPLLNLARVRPTAAGKETDMRWSKYTAANGPIADQATAEGTESFWRQYSTYSGVPTQNCKSSVT